MLQQAARAEAPPAADHPPAGKAEGLGRDWLVLRECRLRPSDRGVLPSVLIHPARGIAVLDILPSQTPDAVEAVRARLYAARFPVIFAGHLPVVHLRATPRQMPFLPSLLDDAFAALPPLRLPGGDAWTGVAARALTAEQSAPRLESQRFRSAAGGRRRRRAAGLRAAGAVLLCLAALGGVLGLLLRGASAPEPGPAPAESTATAAPEEAATREAATPAPRPVPELVPVPPSPAQAPGKTETTAAPASQEPVPAPLPPAVEVPSAPSPHAAPPQPRRSDAAGGTPPAARRPPERPTPRRQQESAGAAAPPTGRGTAATPPEAAPQRCSRIEALVGAGAPLGDGDMRFFNETCIRW